MNSFFIFYIKDQERSAEFYKKVLGMSPVLDVPGMTEFKISDTSSLGLYA